MAPGSAKATKKRKAKPEEDVVKPKAAKAEEKKSHVKSSDLKKKKPTKDSSKTDSSSAADTKKTTDKKDTVSELAKSKKKTLNVPTPDKALHSPVKTSQPPPERKENGDLIFKDHPEFIPNMTPKEVLQAGSFGGTYFRDIYSSVRGTDCKDAWKDLPQDWLEGLDIKTQVASQTYRESVNKNKAKCGGSLQMWEESGWIKKQDPYGWFQWYCRFYEGRRTKDDERQISRWAKCCGTKGRWRSNLVTKIYKANARIDDRSISPVVRQVLLHWAYTLSQTHYDIGAKAAAKRLLGKK